jgi:hypothetical protein
VRCYLKSVWLWVAALTILTLTFASCGSSSGMPTPIIPAQFVVRSYLAPGASLTSPISIRVDLWVKDSLTPVESATIDLDGDGPMPTVEVDIKLLGKLYGQDAGTHYYFDFQWDGQDSPQAKVCISTSGGTFQDDIALQVDWLSEWPYS